jgi:hypothetical protein
MASPSTGKNIGRDIFRILVTIWLHIRLVLSFLSRKLENFGNIDPPQRECAELWCVYIVVAAVILIIADRRRSPK